MMTFKKKWWRHSIIGVMLVGLAVNLIAEATIIKSNSPAEFDLAHMALWFWIGLIGIASLNAGVSFIADAVKQRIYMEMKEENIPGS